MKLYWVLIVVLLTIVLLSFPKKTTNAIVPILAPLNKQDIKLIIIEAAFRHEIDAKKFLATAKCEDKFQNIQSTIVKNGTREESYGVFQIHLPSHPSVSKEQALDPHWASEWSAKKFKKNPRIWTCYRHLYGK